MKGPMSSSFHKEPVQSKTIMEICFLGKWPKVLLKFIDYRTVPQPYSSPTDTTPRKNLRLTPPD